MSDKTRAELKEQIKIINHNYQALKEMHERGYQYSVGEIKRLQDELEHTRKALDKAIWWLNEIVENHRCTPISTAEMALTEIKQITETKDVK